MDLANLDQDAPIELIEIYDWNLSDPGETIYLAAIAGVSFEGQSYEWLPFKTSGWDLIGQGTPPSPEIIATNLGAIVSNWLYLCKQPGYRLEGAKVRRRMTRRQFLDGQPQENAAIKEEPSHDFFIEQVAPENRREVRFTLIDPFNRQGETLPSRPALRNCPWRYRGVECGYVGPLAWDLNNNPILDTARDRCNKSVEACALRFQHELNHGGLPGMQNY